MYNSNSCSNNNYSDEDWERLFKLVFNNVVLFRMIYNNIRLYKKNEIKRFRSLKELQNYRERLFIQKLEYDSKEMLDIGDLPIGGSLKEVKFMYKELSSIKGEAIPYGVEVLTYCPRNDTANTSTPFSTLPPTIHTINNATVINRNLVHSNTDKSNRIIIPPNITSISFTENPTISNKYLRIPNTVKVLKFSGKWDNHQSLDKGDIPDGVTSLSMGGYVCGTLSSYILPRSLKDLELNCNSKGQFYSSYIGIRSFSFIPISVNTLTLNSCVLTSKTNLSTFTSITKLTIKFHNSKSLVASSLPNSLTDLELHNIVGNIEPDFIPSNVRILTLLFDWTLGGGILKNSIPNKVEFLSTNILVNDVDVFPNSLKHFHLRFIRYNSPLELRKMISSLPLSVNSIILPTSAESLKLKLSPTIKLRYLD